ncbi:MAG: PTS sugar transporter subunit IIA [Candidatus Omnitrophica bacterium]|nr:PTS sugar transporter subunit IIA [Candidatus Omnitrophota bacterium]
MKLSSALKSEHITLRLKGSTKVAAIQELLDLLERSGSITNKKQLLAEILEREEVATTGIGKGIGIPHAKSSAFSGVTCALGLAGEGIDFASVDGEPVRIIFLIVASKNMNAQYLSLLANTSRLMQCDDLRNALLQAKDTKQVLDVIMQKENE